MQFLAVCGKYMVLGPSYCRTIQAFWSCHPIIIMFVGWVLLWYGIICFVFVVVTPSHATQCLSDFSFSQKYWLTKFRFHFHSHSNQMIVRTLNQALTQQLNIYSTLNPIEPKLCSNSTEWTIGIMGFVGWFGTWLKVEDLNF